MISEFALETAMQTSALRQLFRTSGEAQFLAHDTKSIRQREIPSLSTTLVLGIIKGLWRASATDRRFVCARLQVRNTPK